MTPRTDVDWIDVDDTASEIREVLINTAHSRLPVAQGHPDNMLGVVQARELLAASLRDEPLDIRVHIRKAPIIPDTLDALDALEVLRQAEVPMALVHDEYGHFDGIVTPADTLDAIAGAFRSDEGTAEPDAMQREDGSWLLAGWMPADEMADQLGIVLPERRDYETVAGLVIGELQHLPSTGEAVETLGWRFEVVDLDGRPDRQGPGDPDPDPGGSLIMRKRIALLIAGLILSPRSWPRQQLQARSGNLPAETCAGSPYSEKRPQWRRASVRHQHPENGRDLPLPGRGRRAHGRRHDHLRPRRGRTRSQDQDRLQAAGR